MTAPQPPEINPVAVATAIGELARALLSRDTDRIAAARQALSEAWQA